MRAVWTRHCKQPGFTLVELIVVIGIIAVLIGVLLPGLVRVLRSGERASIQGSLQGIEQALEAYASDFGDIPRFRPDPTPAYSDPQRVPDPLNSAPDRGARLLARALMGVAPASDEALSGGNVGIGGTNFLFQDGEGTLNDPFGFRIERVNYNSGGDLNPLDTRTSDDGYPGKVYEPYLSPEKYQVTRNALDQTDPSSVILNPNQRPILYFPRSRSTADISQPGSYIGNYLATERVVSRYNYGDNKQDATLSLVLPTAGQFANLLGDADAERGHRSGGRAGDQRRLHSADARA